ncbi:MAG: 30S ribosomal protein S24e [Sulfolobales archaeon]
MERAGSPVKSLKLDEKNILFITREKDNEVLKRLEIEARIEHVGQGTPSREFVKDALSKIYSVNKDLIVIRRIDTSYGRGSSRVIARIYRDIETLKKYEPEYILVRGAPEKKSREKK